MEVWTVKAEEVKERGEEGGKRRTSLPLSLLCVLCVRKPKLREKIPPGRSKFGKWGRGQASRASSVVDRKREKSERVKQNEH